MPKSPTKGITRPTVEWYGVGCYDVGCYGYFHDRFILIVMNLTIRYSLYPNGKQFVANHNIGNSIKGTHIKVFPVMFTPLT